MIPTGPAAGDPAGLLTDARRVVTSPTLAFYRLAETGSRLAPVGVAALAALGNPGSSPLSGVIMVLLAGTGHLSWDTYTALFLVFFPLSYAGTVALLAAAGRLLGAGGSGLTYGQLFRRCWSVIGWVSLPLLLVTGLSLLVGPLLWPSLQTVPTPDAVGTLLTLPQTPPALVRLAGMLWAALLLVVALRQAFSTNTGRAVLAIVILGLFTGGAVHTPISHRIVTLYHIPTVFEEGPAVVMVDLTSGGKAAYGTLKAGDLVALRPPVADVREPSFVLESVYGRLLQVGVTPEAAMGRIVTLAGDDRPVTGDRVLGRLIAIRPLIPGPATSSKGDQTAMVILARAVQDADLWLNGAPVLFVIVRFVIQVLLIGLAAYFIFWVVLPKLFPRRCPKCRAILAKEQTCVYEGKEMDHIILPKIYLVREYCPPCGYKEVKLVPETETRPAHFERGPAARWPFGLSESVRAGEEPSEIARANLRAVMEWDQILQDLIKKHE